MFTGIVEEVGTVKHITRWQSKTQVVIRAETVTQGTKLGDSIAVNGVCLTVVDLGNSSFAADIMPETFRRSNLVGLQAGQAVNLERALAYGDRIGGHFVSGHIDGTAKVTRIYRDQNAIIMNFALIGELSTQIVKKGSIAIDGISLTVGGVEEGSFWVSLVPHTVARTALQCRPVGSTVNIETDMLGKYVSQTLQRTQSLSKDEGLSIERLSRLGY